MTSLYSGLSDSDLHFFIGVYDSAYSISRGIHRQEQGRGGDGRGLVCSDSVVIELVADLWEALWLWPSLTHQQAPDSREPYI